MSRSKRNPTSNPAKPGKLTAEYKAKRAAKKAAEPPPPAPPTLGIAVNDGTKAGERLV